MLVLELDMAPERSIDRRTIPERDVFKVRMVGGANHQPVALSNKGVLHNHMLGRALHAN